MFHSGFFAIPTYAQELQWKVFGHLQYPRAEFGMVAIENNVALVIGGFAEQRGIQKERIRGTVTASCEIIDVASRAILPAPSMNVPHAHGTVLQTIDSNVIVLGGLNTDSTTTPLCEIFDRKKKKWRVLGSLLIGRHRHIAAFINEQEIMVVGGRAKYNYAPAIAEAEIFNIQTGKSRMVVDFPCKGSEGLGFASELLSPHYPMFISGRSEGGQSHRTANIYCYDTLTCCWVHTGYYPDPVHSPSGKRLLDGRLILVGGLQREYPRTPSPYFRIERFGGFEILGSLIQPRLVCSLEQWGNEIIFIIGGSASETLNHTEWFDLRTRQSFEGPPMHEARSYFASASFPIFDAQGVLQGVRILAVGGFGSQNRSLSSVEILETTNLQLLEVPNPEIASQRLKKLLTSPTVIAALAIFILVLIAALLYLLYQVFIIKQKATLPAWEKEMPEVKG